MDAANGASHSADGAAAHLYEIWVLHAMQDGDFVDEPLPRVLVGDLVLLEDLHRHRLTRVPLDRQHHLPKGALPDRLDERVIAYRLRRPCRHGASGRRAMRARAPLPNRVARLKALCANLCAVLGKTAVGFAALDVATSVLGSGIW